MPSTRAISDQHLIQIVDAALAEATQKSGEWLVCRAGCTQCCMGAFSITQLDALRLRRGLAELEITDPARAARVRERVQESVARLSADFPGDPATGISVGYCTNGFDRNVIRPGRRGVAISSLANSCLA